MAEKKWTVEVNADQLYTMFNGDDQEIEDVVTDLMQQIAKQEETDIYGLGKHVSGLFGEEEE
jgi:hypothetical protein